MKKLLFNFILIFVLLFFNNIVTFANSYSKNQESFSITNGIEQTDEAITTFEKSKTITGYAPVGSKISIKVYEKLPDKKENLNLIEENTIVVGSTGYFNQDISLVVGENIINIEVLNSKNKLINSIDTTIKRKKIEIKAELEQSFNLTRTRK